MPWEALFRNVKNTLASESVTHGLSVSDSFSDLRRKQDKRNLVGVTLRAQYFGSRLEDPKANALRDALADALKPFNLLPKMDHPHLTSQGMDLERLESRPLVFKFNLPAEEVAALEKAFRNVHPSAQKIGGEDGRRIQLTA